MSWPKYLNFLSDRELIGKAIVYWVFLVMMIYGIKTIVSKRVTLRYRRLKEDHKGESAVIWGAIFLFAGILGIMIATYGCIWFSTC